MVSSPVRAGVRLLMVAALVCGVAASVLAAPRKKPTLDTAPVSRKTLMVFPLDSAGIGAPNLPAVTKTVGEVVLSRFQLAKTYMVAEFYRGYPQIARLIADASLSSADITAPFGDDNRKAAKIVRSIGFDYAFVGWLQDYRFDAEKKQVTITANGLMLEGTRDAIGYKIVKSAVGSGTAPVATGGEEAAAIVAARAAADQLMTEALSKAAPAAGAPAGK